MARAEIVVWRHSGNWMKVYVDGALVWAGHETDYQAEDWVELMQRVGAAVTLRDARPDESEME